jgi:hypothetical protein
MLQVIYSSKAASQIGPGDVFRIIQQSARNNGKAGLTGFLIYQNGRFFQVLEGEKPPIDDVMRRVERDPRHSAITIISRREIDERAFPAWRMKRLCTQEVPGPLREIAPELEMAPPPIRSAATRFLAALQD